MAFDKTQPTDSTKIRNLGTVVRPNWVAIEDADSSFKPVGLNLDNRTALAVANDPTAIADASILYCKDDVAGDTQVFAINENSTITQLSGTLFSAATNGQLTIAGGLLIKWGQTTGSSGAKTFPVAFPTNCYNVQVTVEDNNARYGSIKLVTTTGFTWTPDSAASTIHYIAIGD